MQPDWIWNDTEIDKFLNQVETTLGREHSTTNGEQVSAIIGILVQFFGSCGTIIASAKYHYNNTYRAEYAKVVAAISEKEYKGAAASPSVLKEYIASRCAIESARLSRAERTQAAITHSMDGLRSILSSLKEERKKY
jgi:hypothetical protein